MSNTKEITIESGRVLIFPDIHGCYDEFMAKLDELGFNFDEDKVILLGDLVDRGPKSLDCFNLIYKNWTEVIRGNHEQFCYDAIYNDLEKRVHVSNGGMWFYNLPLDVQRVIGTEVGNMPITLTLNRNGKRYGFVHGDIPSFTRDWDELNSFLNGLSHETYENMCIWGRSRARSNSEINCRISGVEHVYLGHTVFHNPKHIGNMTFLDTGLVYKLDGYGKLSYIEL